VVNRLGRVVVYLGSNVIRSVCGCHLDDDGRMSPEVGREV
jgi:hypothetical protein